jgi:hypothetical protein
MMSPGWPAPCDFGRIEMAKAPERTQRRHVREKATIDHLVQDVYKPKPIDKNTASTAQPLPAACWSRIRSARNGIPAKVACPFSDENLVYMIDIWR